MEIARALGRLEESYKTLGRTDKSRFKVDHRELGQRLQELSNLILQTQDYSTVAMEIARALGGLEEAYRTLGRTDKNRFKVDHYELGQRLQELSTSLMQSSSKPSVEPQIKTESDDSFISSTPEEGKPEMENGRRRILKLEHDDSSISDICPVSSSQDTKEYSSVEEIQSSQENSLDAITGDSTSVQDSEILKNKTHNPRRQSLDISNEFSDDPDFNVPRPKIYKCRIPVCGKTFGSRQDLQTHKERYNKKDADGNLKNYNCTKCLGLVLSHGLGHICGEDPEEGVRRLHARAKQRKKRAKKKRLCIKPKFNARVIGECRRGKKENLPTAESIERDAVQGHDDR